jgi:hypothetical protein
MPFMRALTVDILRFRSPTRRNAQVVLENIRGTSMQYAGDCLVLELRTRRHNTCCVCLTSLVSARQPHCCAAADVVSWSVALNVIVQPSTRVCDQCWQSRKQLPLWKLCVDASSLAARNLERTAEPEPHVVSSRGSAFEIFSRSCASGSMQHKRPRPRLLQPSQHRLMHQLLLPSLFAHLPRLALPKHCVEIRMRCALLPALRPLAILSSYVVSLSAFLVHLGGPTLFLCVPL